MKSIGVQAGLASIIVPCWNQLEFTRHCLNALRRHTRQPWELIVVNNGSTDGTGDYLAGVQDMSPVPVTIVANARNLGFPAAINQGLKLASGEFLVLLNNDVVVTEGWLEHLIALTSASTGEEGDRSATEIAARTGHGGGLDLTIIDFNEIRGDAADRLTPAPCPSLPRLQAEERCSAFSRWSSRRRERPDGALWSGSRCSDDRAGRADVQLCRAATVGRSGALLRPRRNAWLRPAVARRAPGEMAHCPQALGILPVDEAGRL